MSDNCYCSERKENPELHAQLLADGIPDGYCGQCSVCGTWGHTCAHPRQPYTDAWCDEHWQAVMNEPAYTLPQLILIILIATLFVVVVAAQVLQ